MFSMNNVRHSRDDKIISRRKFPHVSGSASPALLMGICGSGTASPALLMGIFGSGTDLVFQSCLSSVVDGNLLDKDSPIPGLFAVTKTGGIQIV
jgi:hypothetical protein